MSKYELLEIVGRGAYGDVAKAKERSTDSSRAIKRMKDILDHQTDAKRAFREIHLLRHLNHPNIIPLRDVISNNNDIETLAIRKTDISVFDGILDNSLSRRPYAARPKYGDLYLIFDFVDTDLAKIIKSKQYMTTKHIKFILYQILLGLKYVHSANVIHRDLKPANILISCTDCIARVADFGLARVVDPSAIDSQTFGNPETLESQEPTMLDVKKAHTSHVVTRWYRAPEVILVLPYSAAVDVWSVGCIFAELLGMDEKIFPDIKHRKPLFPGNGCGLLSPSSDDEDETDIFGGERGQLTLIFKVLGIPEDEDLAHLDERSRDLIKKRRSHINPKGLNNIYVGATDEDGLDLLTADEKLDLLTGLDLLTRMLHFNPNKRITVDEALAHPFLASIRKIEKEVVCKNPMNADVELLFESTNNDVLANVARELRIYSDLNPNL